MGGKGNFLKIYPGGVTLFRGTTPSPPPCRSVVFLSDLGRVLMMKIKMEACNSVEKELDKLLGRFNTFQDSVDKLDELINHVKATKNGIDEGI